MRIANLILSLFDYAMILIDSQFLLSDEDGNEINNKNRWFIPMEVKLLLSSGLPILLRESPMFIEKRNNLRQ